MRLPYCVSDMPSTVEVILTTFNLLATGLNTMILPVAQPCCAQYKNSCALSVQLPISLRFGFNSWNVNP